MKKSSDGGVPEAKSRARREPREGHRADAAPEGPEAGQAENVKNGSVAWFSDEKGYGFITPDDGGKDVFVHRYGIAAGGSDLRKGQTVEYETVEGGPRGRRAVNVVVMADPDGTEGR